MERNSTSPAGRGSGQPLRERDGAVVALAGNPNVGKSTLGKTVSAAYGNCEYNGENYTVVDLPGPIPCRRIRRRKRRPESISSPERRMWWWRCATRRAWRGI